MPWIVKLILFVMLMLLSELYFFKRIYNSIRIMSPNSRFLRFKGLRWLLLSIINFVPVFFLISWIIEIITGFEIDLPSKNSFYDFFFYYPFWIAIITILQTVVIILPLDIIRLLLIPIKSINKQNMKELNAKIVLIITIILLIYVPARILFDATQVSVRETSYISPNLKKGLNNLRIGLISDIQADWYNSNERIENYINKLNNSNPDIVFIPGDMITNDKESIPIAAAMVGKIKAKYGVYACVGDHDNWAYGRNINKSRSEVIKQLSIHGVEMLDNTNRIVQIDSNRLGMTFITDTYSERIDYYSLDSLTSDFEDVDLKIFITHQPNGRMKEMAVKKNYDLMLSGHTHGGQITLLFPFINLTPTLIETNYVKGDFWFDKLLMVVNGGLGMSLAPIRYNSTPEVTLIVLKGK